jgi:hypothetical protein
MRRLAIRKKNDGERLPGRDEPPSAMRRNNSANSGAMIGATIKR